MNVINRQQTPGTTALRRQWLLLAEMANAEDGLAVKEMADRHSVSQKTIRRDLDQLRSVGIPLRETVSRHGKKHWTIGGFVAGGLFVSLFPRPHGHGPIEAGLIMVRTLGDLGFNFCATTGITLRPTASLGRIVRRVAELAMRVAIASGAHNLSD